MIKVAPNLLIKHNKNRGVHIRMADKAHKRVKRELRRMTKRNRSQSMKERIQRINAYLRGWVRLLAFSDAKSIFERSKVGCGATAGVCLEAMEATTTRLRELRGLGLPEWVAHEFAYSRKGPWRMAGGRMNRALGTAYWRSRA